MGGAILKIGDTIILVGLILDERPVVGVRFLVCGDMGWQILDEDKHKYQLAIRCILQQCVFHSKGIVLTVGV